MSDWNKTIQEMFAPPELDKAEAVDDDAEWRESLQKEYERAEHHKANAARLSSELAASRERERALERERDEARNHIHAIADYVDSHWKGAGRPLSSDWIIRELVHWADEWATEFEAAEAEVKRLRAETIKECIAVVDAFKDSEDVNALAAVAESKGVKSPGWIKDAMHSHAGELAGKIIAALRALADANTQGGVDRG